MSKEFNYKRARLEWALPEWGKLGEEFKALYRLVQVKLAGVSQNRSLGIDREDCGREVKSRFAELAAKDPEGLARAAHVIHDLGYWDDGEARKSGDGVPRDEHGGYWKFEILAKQALIEAGGTGELRHKVDAEHTKTVQSFMDHKEGTNFDNGELSGLFTARLAPHFASAEVVCVNFRPHPFVIGQRHFREGSMYPDPKSAPCAHCGKPYDEHTHDTVIALTLCDASVEGGLAAAAGKDQVTLTRPALDALKGLKDDMDKYHIDGFTVVKP